MRNEFKVAAFVGGELKELVDESTSSEVVLALPLSRLLVKILRIPADQDAVVFAEPIMKALSPYPDEPLAVSCETISESDDGKVVIAAALPESSADDIAESLDAAKLSVVKIDALALGALRGIWSELNVGDGARRLVILRSVDCLTLIVLDGDRPVSIRAVSTDAEMRRERMLSLLEAEDFGGPRELIETIEREIDVDSAMAGVRDRAIGDGALDALPESWRDVLNETRFKAKLIRNLSIAGGIWLLVMATLLGVPVVYGYMTDHVKDLCKQHDRAYRAVKDMKDRTEAVRKYSDHALGALEMLKAVSDAMPEGVTMTSWQFNRDKGVEFHGTSQNGMESVYQLKDAMVGLEREDGEPIFANVSLGSMTSKRTGEQSFQIECSFEADDDDQ